MTDPTQLASETFAVGEIALCVSRYGRPTVECEILHIPNGCPTTFAGVYLADGDEYIIRCADDPQLYSAFRGQLLKKRPPHEDLQVVRWDECPWQPEVFRV